ncbi:MAG TPA: glycosyltransferase [Candidatus Binataceae bacterium]|nr:glycosyltransferase [Candidatus Binataceae bacterium]
MATSSPPRISAAPAPAITPAARARPRLLVVMYANPNYHPPTVNGVRMMSERFEVQIVCRNDAGPAADWAPGVTIERVGEIITAAQAFDAPAWRKLSWYRRFVRRLGCVIAETGPALIYAYDPIGFAASIAALGPRRKDIPVVFHCHDTPALGRVRLASLQDWILRYAMRHTRDAAFTIFPSKYRAPIWLDKARDPRPPMIIPNGAARDFYPPREDEDWSALARRRWESKRVLYVGSMGAENGQPDAIRALEFLPAPVALDLIGFSTPEYRIRLSQMAAALALAGRVSIAGWVPNPERIRRAEDAAVGLVLYHAANPNWEHSGPSPNKLFEYAAWGLPVVVPDRKSFREFFADDEWVAYANPEDPASIARAIEFILADRDRYIAMSLAARRAHETKYNYEQVFAPVLERLLALAGVADDPAARCRRSSVEHQNELD